MKKLFSLLLALTLVFSLATTALAEETTYTITTDDASHTYNIYQIFTGDLSTANNTTVLSNLKWGANAKIPAAAEGETQAKIGDDVPESVLTELKEANTETATDASKLEVIKKYVDLESGAFRTLSCETNSVTVPAGYYLIKDVNTTTAGETLSTYIVKVSANFTISPKKDTPESQKKVKDTNDSTGVTTDWQDSADYDIGDSVPFQITFTLPTDYESYTNYKVVVHDRQSAGLDFNEGSVKVYVDPASDNATTTYEISGFTTNSGSSILWSNGCENENYATTCTFHIVCDNIKDLTYNNGTKLTNGDKLIFEYNSTLNTGAVLGSTGNPNEMDVEFSNNPYGEGTTNTPDDAVIVFTYKVNIDKVDQNKQPLTGANFTLYKEVPASTEGAQTGEAIKVDFATNVKATALENAKSYIVVGNKTGGATGSTFEFKGVDDGNYVLVETTIPAGYNAWDAVAFSISATHDVTSDNPALTALNGGDLFTGDAGSIILADGKLSTTIENKSGTELPETGGMGTTLFYVVGGIMVAAAVILLVTKKRMSAEV